MFPSVTICDFLYVGLYVVFYFVGAINHFFSDLKNKAEPVFVRLSDHPAEALADRLELQMRQEIPVNPQRGCLYKYYCM